MKSSMANDALCDRLGGDLPLIISFHSKGIARNEEYTIAELGKELERNAIELAYITTQEKLVTVWCGLKNFGFIRFEIISLEEQLKRIKGNK